MRQDDGNPAPARLDEKVFRLDGRVAVVTGGSGGIGEAICRLFANVGASVACLDLDAGRAYATAEAIAAQGGHAIGLACDVACEHDTLAAVADVAAQLGRPTVLVNTAATFDQAGSILDIDIDEWERVHRVNLPGAFMMSRAVLPSMIEAGGGSIIHLSSMYGRMGRPARVSYASTKAALLQLARSMAVDHAGSGVRVNTLSPGPIDTARVSVRLAALSEEARRERLSRYLFKRIGRPDEVATAALFLASNASSFVTGVDLLVDGGVSFGN